MPQALRTRRILLVDDSGEDRAAVRRLLALDASAIHEVEEAVSIAAGLRAIRQARFDCVLLDYQLPDGDGMQFLGELSRVFAEDTMVAVVMLTGRTDEDLIVEALQHGAQDYLVKGRFTSEVLRRSINDSIIRVETRRELDRLHREAREAIRQKDEVHSRQAATEARLRHQLALTEIVARTTTEGLCMVDSRGRFTFVNPAAEAILGAVQGDLLGASLVDLLADVGGSGALGRLGWDGVVGATTTIRDREAAWPRAGGDAIPVAFSAAPIRADGEMVGTVIALRDITERRRFEAAMGQKTAELVEAGRKKDEFLAVLAHELRNPLAPILNAMRIIGLRGGAIRRRSGPARWSSSRFAT